MINAEAEADQEHVGRPPAEQADDESAVPRSARALIPDWEGLPAVRRRAVAAMKARRLESGNLLVPMRAE